MPTQTKKTTLPFFVADVEMKRARLICVKSTAGLAYYFTADEVVSVLPHHGRPERLAFIRLRDGRWIEVEASTQDAARAIWAEALDQLAAA